MVDEAVHGGKRHGLVGEDSGPLAEGLVGGGEQGATLVARADQLEEDAGLGLALGDVGDVIEDQEVVLVELGDGTFELEVAPRTLELLDAVCRAGEEDAPAVLDEGEAETGRDV